MRVAILRAPFAGLDGGDDLVIVERVGETFGYGLTGHCEGDRVGDFSDLRQVGAATLPELCRPAARTEPMAVAATLSIASLTRAAPTAMTPRPRPGNR